MASNVCIFVVNMYINGDIPTRRHGVLADEKPIDLINKLLSKTEPQVYMRTCQPVVSDPKQDYNEVN